eukprot:CAMPEP_0119268000 /NCGR_PEP_ID=MMETSP1329-20130426/5931_1 /TAXON_ID=114041 /ORGANISM="Genus nov. species nov., Strain RCC1024" /LENGTH=42 /DNA_ID= /DNA_START= /DNA_END= /DNA_ORIENTATION=
MSDASESLRSEEMSGSSQGSRASDIVDDSALYAAPADAAHDA